MPLAPQDREYLRMMYEENAEHARQHETLRAAATGLFIALIAGIMAFYSAQDRGPAWILGALVCAISVLGGLINYKHYERYELHLQRLRGYRRELESDLDVRLSQIGEKERLTHNNKYPYTHRFIKLHILWLVVYIATFIIGVVFIVSAYLVK